MAPRLTLSVSDATSGILASWPTFDQRLVGRHHVVVGVGVDHIDLADQAARGAAHVHRAGRCGFHQRHAQRGQQRLQFLDHDHRVGLAGVVDHAHALGVGHNLLDQLHLLVQRQQVGHASHVGLGGLPLEPPAWRPRGRSRQRTPRARFWSEATTAWAEGVAMATMASGLSPTNLRAICAAVPVLPWALWYCHFRFLPDSKPAAFRAALHAVAHGVQGRVLHDGRHGHGFLLGMARWPLRPWPKPGLPGVPSERFFHVHLQ